MCENYEFSYIDLLIPRLNILNTPCTSDDKTQMFAIALFRLLIVYYLTEQCKWFNIFIVLTLISIFIIIIQVPQDIQDEINMAQQKEIPLFVDSEDQINILNPDSVKT